MKTFFLLFFFSLLCNRGLSQQDKPMLINGQYDSIQLKELFQRIESQSPCYFYYDQRQVDSIVVSVNANNEPLRQVLEKALLNTGLQFSIDKLNRVFVTKGFKLQTELPGNFFMEPVGQNQVAAKDSVIDYGFTAKKPERLVSENKLYEIGSRTNAVKGNVIITGNLRNAKTGEPLVNASVFVDNSIFSTTDAYGNYLLTLAPGKHTLNILAIGMRDTHLQLMVYGDGRMDADIPEQVVTLKEVIVSSQKTRNITQVQMGVERLNIENIRRVPSLFGETDVLRVITSLPGVKTVGEASTGFNVRGGSADQNLVLFNNATIYNPSHFFGMFSAFNPELIKDIELYKSSIPAKFGGRLASVLDVNSREGNKKKISGSAGLGVITSRVNLEGPIIKDRTSFIFGARTTYANWLIDLLPGQYRNSRASFQDIDLGISHKIDTSNNLYLSVYFSNDRFALNTDTTYQYSNRNANLKWKKSFNNKFSGEIIAGIDEYNYSVAGENNEINAFTLRFNIQQLHARLNFVYYKNQQHSFDFGLSSIRYKLRPGTMTPRGNESLVKRDEVEAEQALESGVYFTHRFNPNNKLSISTGARYSVYNYLGAQNVNYYAPGLPVVPGNIIETKSYEKGQFIKTYGRPELRFSMRYAFSTTFSVKAGYNSQTQYIHVLSNTTAIAPTDIWKLSEPNIKPQQGDQVSIGFYKNLKSNTIETSLELYYKNIKDYLDYKPGADLVLNHDIETEVVNTKGKAYGIELLIKKPGGKLNGWLSYTYSRILLRSSDPVLATAVNKGRDYPANYDKPHDFTLMGVFRVNHRFSISLNSTYSTGRPITLPMGRFYYAGSQRLLYSERNAYRIPDYFRTDLSVNVEGNHKVNQKTHNSWTFGFYNLFGRKNPYSVYFVSENGMVNGYKLSIFGSIIPFINYNIRF